jgi:ABC-type antimicrobial peptide transport system permease subunit
MAFGPLTQHISYAEETLRASDRWDHFISAVQIQYIGEAGLLEPRIREAFRQVDPNFAIIDIQPLEQVIAAQFDQQRIAAQLAGFFSMLALGLASIGLYGATAYSVARKNKEIGIRMAVGATRSSILALVFRGAFAQVLVGVLLGVPISILLGRVLSTRLYEVSHFDLGSLLLAIASMTAGAFIASLIPATRAAWVEPAKVLASE